MSPVVETLTACALATFTGTCGIVAWGMWRADRDRVSRVDHINHLAHRLTRNLSEETAARALLEARVHHLEERAAAQWGTGPRMGVIPGGRRTGTPGARQRPATGLPGAVEGNQ